MWAGLPSAAGTCGGAAWSGNRMNDIDLISACLGGNPSAWSLLVDRLSPVVWRTVRRLVGPALGQAGAEDTFQDVFVRLLRDDHKLLWQYDPRRASLDAYAILVARSVSLDRLRRKQRDPLAARSQEGAREPDTMAHAPAEDPASGDWALEAFVETLPAREREVILLLFRDGMDTARVAEVLGVSDATVRSTKSHALQRLRKRLQDI